MAKLNKKFQTKSLLLVLAILILPLKNVAQETNWNITLSKIKLFSSTRKDVENLFKYSELKETEKSDGIQTVYYDFDGGWLSVNYSIGKCRQHHSPVGYNVEENVAVGLYIFFSEYIKMSKFSFDLRSFEKNKVSNAIVYSNETLGIEITGGDNDIGSIDFSPSATQKKKYGCSNLK